MTTTATTATKTTATNVRIPRRIKRRRYYSRHGTRIRTSGSLATPRPRTDHGSWWIEEMEMRMTCQTETPQGQEQARYQPRAQSSVPVQYYCTYERITARPDLVLSCLSQRPERGEEVCLAQTVLACFVPCLLIESAVQCPGACISPACSGSHRSAIE